MRFLPALILLCLASLGFGVATTTTLNYTQGANPVNKNTHITTNSTENIVIVQVTPGHPVTVEWNNDGGGVPANGAAWIYRSTDSATATTTTDKSVAANTPLKLRYTQTTTFYHVRQSADGVITATPLLVE